MKILTFLRAKHNLVFKIGVILCVAFIIAWLLPSFLVKSINVGPFESVWNYDDLVINEDLLIPKSKKELENEQQQILENNPLVFEEKTDELKLKKNNLLTIFKNKPNTKELIRCFDSIYKTGIIEQIDEDGKNKKMILLSGNFAEPLIYYNYFTLSSAINFIKTHHPKTDTINFSNYLAISIFQNKEKTNYFLNEKMKALSAYNFVLRKGNVLIKYGDNLTANNRYLINYYNFQQRAGQKSSILNLFAKFVLVSLILGLLLGYLVFFRTTIFGQNKQVFFLLACLFTEVVITNFCFKYHLLILAIPFTVLPIIIRVFFDSRTALFTHLLAILICAFYLPNAYEFIILQIIAGIITLFAIAEMRKRQQILNASLIVLIVYLLVFVSYQLMFGNYNSITKISNYLPFVISSVLVLLSYPLIYLSEKLFGFISDFRLLELCDLNQPLLRQLSQEVPGTFQHSLQVANLAEEAIFYIGGNTLLVRTGALYHDIGKIKNPKFFTENQGNNYSPHQEMQPLESAKIIISHVIAGIEMAKKNKLPETIIDFIRTHHGTTHVGYFLNLYKKQNSELTEEIKNEFKYRGPIPFSKETAVLMLADGVEAASRSLKQHDALSINDIVDEIIDYKISQNQLINSDITFKDITVVKKIFKKRLMTIYHARIEYPK